MNRDRHLTIQNLGLIQRQAGVDPEVAELVVAYGRLLVDSGQALSFNTGPFPRASREREIQSRLSAQNPQTDARFLSFLAAWAGEMEQRQRTPVFSRADLANHLGTTPQQLRGIIGARANYYRKRKIPKSNGTFRTIHVPRAPLRPVQRWIFTSILSGFCPASVAHGFTRERSILTNAVNHQGKRVVLCVDVLDFFPSIKFRMVREGFQHLGYPYSVALDLANLCTIGGVLPQGASTSPALSNLACIRLDKRLTGLATSLNHNYSRYADDLVFSSDDKRLPSILPFLREILAEEGFRLAEHKTRIYGAGCKQLVNGIVVNKSPNLPRDHIRRMRAALHRLRTQGNNGVQISSKQPGTHDPLKVLRGHLAFLKMINPARAEALLSSGASQTKHLPLIS